MPKLEQYPLNVAQLLEEVETYAKRFPFRNNTYNYKTWETEKIDHIYNTNAIEGNSLTKRETYLAVMDNGAMVSASIGNLIDALNNLTTYDKSSLMPYYEAYQALTDTEKASIADLPEILEMISTIYLS